MGNAASLVRSEGWQAASTFREHQAGGSWIAVDAEDAGDARCGAERSEVGLAAPIGERRGAFTLWTTRTEAHDCFTASAAAAQERAPQWPKTVAVKDPEETKASERAQRDRRDL